VEAEQQALKAGKGRKAAIYAAYDRFYKGDIAREFVRGSQEQGGLHTMEDLANWKTPHRRAGHGDLQGDRGLQADDVGAGAGDAAGPQHAGTPRSQGMGLNSAKYIHTLYQVMNLTFADRDFYYGDPYVMKGIPIRGLLSKEYAAARRSQIDWARNDAAAKPGDPYPFEGRQNPYLKLLETWGPPKLDPPALTAEERRRTTRRFARGPRRSRRRTKRDGWSR